MHLALWANIGGIEMSSEDKTMGFKWAIGYMSKQKCPYCGSRLTQWEARNECQTCMARKEKKADA
jgi:hypothetical protein